MINKVDVKTLRVLLDLLKTNDPLIQNILCEYQAYFSSVSECENGTECYLNAKKNLLCLEHVYCGVQTLTGYLKTILSEE